MKKTAKAFSLIEVVLALGVASVALVGILALVPIALKTARTSQDETRVAQIAQKVCDDLRSRHGVQNGRDPILNFETNIFPTASPVVIYYNQENQALPTPENAYYAMTLTIEASPPQLTSGYISYLNFRWPAVAATNVGTSNQFVVLIRGAR
jgi:uncharacterized protein (TIGR02598 family)